MLFSAFLALAAASGDAQRTLDVPAFHSVDLAFAGSAQVVQSPVTRVQVTGEESAVRCVTAKVHEGKLVIGWARSGEKVPGRDATGNTITVVAPQACGKSKRSQRVLVRIAAPAIDAVSISGSGNLHARAIRAPHFSASVPGSGTIRLDDLRAAKTSLAIAGSGDIIAAGTLGQLQVSLAGSGDIDTRAARASTLDVNLAGENGGAKLGHGSGGEVLLRAA